MLSWSGAAIPSHCSRRARRSRLMRLFGRGRQSRESNHRTAVLPYLTDHLNKLVLQFKSPWRDGTTHISMSPLEFMQRLAALVPRPRLHLIRFHGVLDANTGPRAAIPVHNAGACSTLTSNTTCTVVASSRPSPLSRSLW